METYAIEERVLLTDRWRLAVKGHSTSIPKSVAAVAPALLPILLLLLVGCYDPIKEFDNPYDPINGGELPAGDSGGGADTPLVEGETFTVAVDSAIEFMVPPEIHGGLVYRHYEPIFYRIQDAGELDYTGSLESDLSALPLLDVTLDGDVAEWGDVPPVYTDTGGDAPGTGPGEDLTNFYMARNEGDNLYVAFELADTAPSPDNLYVLHMADSAGFGWGSPGFLIFHDETDWVGVVSGEGTPITGARTFNATGIVEGLTVDIGETSAALSGSPGDHLAIFGLSRALDSQGEEIELVFNLPPITEYTEYTGADLATLLDLKIGTTLRTEWFSQAASGTLTVGRYNPDPGAFYIEATFGVETAAGDTLNGSLMVDGWQ